MSNAKQATDDKEEDTEEATDNKEEESQDKKDRRKIIQHEMSILEEEEGFQPSEDSDDGDDSESKNEIPDKDKPIVVLTEYQKIGRKEKERRKRRKLRR